MNRPQPASDSTAGNHPVVVVLGRPDPAFEAGLRSVGLVPVADDGSTVIWGIPTPVGLEVPCAAEPDPWSGLLMTLGDAALSLGLDRGALYERIGRGELDVVQVGRVLRIPVRAVHDLKARRAGNSRPPRATAP